MLQAPVIVPRAGAEGGFTLIEVVVALTLLGMVAAILASGTRLSLDIVARTNAKTDAVRLRRLEVAIVRSQLQGALPFRWWTRTDGKRTEHTGFQGGETGVRFVSRTGIKDGPGSLPRWIDLRAEGSPGPQRRLVLEERRILSPDNQPEGQPAAAAEISDCRDPQFQYLDRIDDRPQWLSAWDPVERRAALPWAVRLRCDGTEGRGSMLIPLDHADSARQGMRFQ